MTGFGVIPDHGLDWLEASGEHSDVVLSTRVRIARNLRGMLLGLEPGSMIERQSSGAFGRAPSDLRC